MSLFIDGPVSSIEDLTAQDSQLLQVASGEGIDVTRKLALAKDELAVELETLLAVESPPEASIWYPSGSVGLGNVVVTRALQFWHTFRSLELVYSDAYHSQLNDRYKGKRDQFRERTKWAYEKLVASGIGMVGDPIPRAETPEVSSAAGLRLPDGTYYVTIAWVNNAGEEGECATPASIDLVASALVVNPRSGPSTAQGWNVFLGTAPDLLVQQNQAPVGRLEAWLQPGILTTAGRGPSAGQPPGYRLPVLQRIQRG